jgi:putative Mg2+ transporter-C (MgtC) family protein
LIGIGFYFPATLAAALTLGTLSFFRWIESRVPAQFYALFVVRFARDNVMTEDAMRQLLNGYGFTTANLNYRLDGEAGFFEYRMTIRTNRASNASDLSRALSKLDSVKEYRVSPTGD